MFGICYSYYLWNCKDLALTLLVITVTVKLDIHCYKYSSQQNAWNSLCVLLIDFDFGMPIKGPRKKSIHPSGIRLATVMIYYSPLSVAMGKTISFLRAALAKRQSYLPEASLVGIYYKYHMHSLKYHTGYSVWTTTYTSMRLNLSLAGYCF